MARTERKADQIRDVEIFPLCNPYAEGSCTIRVGNLPVYHRHRGRKGAAPCA